MAWKVIDKNSGNVFVSKSGKSLDNLNDDAKALFESVHYKIGDLDNFEIVPVRTTYEERKDYYKGNGLGQVLNQVFPNLSEQNMRGNSDFNLGNVWAGIKDVASLPGRALDAVNNSVFGNNTFDLGRRTGEGGGFVSEIVRDPTLPFMTVGAPYLAKGVQLGANLGKKVNLGKNSLGKVFGAIGAGALEGGALEAANAAVNERDITLPGVITGAAMGGVFEGLGQGVQALLQKYGKDLVRTTAESLKLGNTERRMTDKDLKDFLSNEKNVELVEAVLNQQSTGLNLLPGRFDRGKGLDKVIDNASQYASSRLKGQRKLNPVTEGIDENLHPSEFEAARRKRILDTPEKEIENYPNKTITKLNKRDVDDYNYPYEVPEKRGLEKNRYNFKDDVYQTNANYNLEKYAEKYDGISSRFNGAKTHGREMNQEELKFLDLLKSEIDNDKKILSGYNPDYVIKSNKFIGDRMPFGKKKLNDALQELALSNGNKGFSSEFVKEVTDLAGDAYSYGRDVSDGIFSALVDSGKKGALERAFAYANSSDYAVKKGYRDAVDKFADTLSDYADMSVGKERIDANGKKYMVNKDKMAKYAYSYLAKVQDLLEKNMALSPENITALYGEATKVNDEVVQDAVLQLLRDLEVPEGTINQFKKDAGIYTMLNKSRSRMKRNVSKEKNLLDGTILAPFVPQKGFNAKNAWAYKLQKNNLGLSDFFKGRNDPTRAGNAARQVMYNLGLHRDSFSNK